MEYRAEYDGKKRKYPERDKVTVGKTYNAAHNTACKRHYPVLRCIGAGLRSVGEPRNQIKNAVYRKRYQDPELNIGIYRLAYIIRYVVIDEYRHFKRYTDDGHYEKGPLKFKPYGSLKIPERGIIDRLAVHMRYLVE